MLLEDFDVEKYERSLKREGYEEGERAGLQRGQERVSLLYQQLKDDNRMEDLMKAIDDIEYRRQLLEEFNL